MNKKLITVILALVLTLTIGLAACGGSGETNARQITVSYMIDGAEHSKETISEGSTPNLPTPTKDGYTFEKWHLDEWYETEYTEDAFKALTIPEDNTIKLYGRYNKNELTFDEAVAAYKAGKPLYIYSTCTPPLNPDRVQTSELYMDDSCIMVKFSVTGLGERVMYYDRTAEKTYDIGSERKILAKSLMEASNLEEMFAIEPITGDGVDATVEVGETIYDCLKFGEDSDAIHFIKENGKLTKVYQNEILNENVVISTEIPTTSSFYNVSRYTKSDMMRYTANTSNISPDLEEGKVYYFEPIGDKTLAVGDIVLLIVDYGTAAMAGKITSISGTTYMGIPDMSEASAGQSSEMPIDLAKYILVKD